MDNSIAFHYVNQVLLQVSYVLGGLSLITTLSYLCVIGFTRSPRKKYNIISRNELWLIHFVYNIALLAAAVRSNANFEEISPLWIFVRAFCTLCTFLVVTLILRTYLKAYYPYFVHKRLNAIRYMPRISPVSGNPMTLLSEEEEDIHLSESMKQEEDIFTIDYDVWIDETTGFKHIEKYDAAHSLPSKCPECEYYTLKIVKEDLVREPSEFEPGHLVRHFKCSYCNHRKQAGHKIKVAEMVPA